MDELKKPLEELEKAKSYLNSMRSAKSLEEFEEYWKSYLSRLERVWNKFLAAYKNHPKWHGWGGKHIKVKKDDPLLSYLTNARGADEHTIAEITEKSSGSMTINPAFGRVWNPERIEINRGVVKIDSAEPYKITFTPAKIRLLPVINRGVTFPVPTSHLENPVDPNNIIAIAELGIAYYNKVLEDSKSVFN